MSLFEGQPRADLPRRVVKKPRMDAAGGSVPGLAGSSVGAMPEVRTDSQVGSTTVVPGVQAQVQAQSAAGIGSGSQVGVTNGMPASQGPVPHQPENSTWPAATDAIASWLYCSAINPAAE